jgi:homoserine acetyltransferase
VRRTSPRQLGRFDARGWIGTVDVPTAILVTTEDTLVPPHNQQDLVNRIRGAHVQELALDHDAVVSQAETFVPALRKAVEYVLGC